MAGQISPYNLHIDIHTQHVQPLHNVHQTHTQMLSLSDCVALTLRSPTSALLHCGEKLTTNLSRSSRASTKIALMTSHNFTHKSEQNSGELSSNSTPNNRVL